jgi:hypothetical protein
MVPKNAVYVLAPAQFIGAIPVRQDITVLPADDPKKLRLGWVIYEENPSILDRGIFCLLSHL